MTDVSAAAAAAGVYLPGLAAQLDQDILEAERHLAELRALRENMQQLLKYAADVARTAAPVQQSASTTAKTSLTDQVVQVFEDDPGAVLEVDDVIRQLERNDVVATPESVRNAVYYAVNTDRLTRQGRGKFTLKKTSGFVVSNFIVTLPGEGASEEVEATP
jgi:ribosome recycling factor